MEDSNLSAGPGSLPRYVMVADRLRQRIQRGEWRAGDSVPSLHRLADEFNVARLTARQAVQVLVREGLLSARRGQGTFVAQSVAPVKTARLEMSLAELGDTYRELEPTLLACSDTPVALPDGLDDRARYIRMRRLHSRRGQPQPYCLIEIYLAQAVYAQAPARFRERAVIPVMLEFGEPRIAQARQVLTIGTADAETAMLLRTSVGAPIAHVRRTFAGEDGGILYYAEVAYRGDTIRLEVDLMI